MTYTDACDYVQTDTTSGLVQFVLLHMEGLTKTSAVLEIGCGALHAARPLLAYLDVGQYVGVDPNPWLREAARVADPTLDRLCYHARFETRDDFHTDERYDVIFAHSVLTHVSTEQLHHFLHETRAQLRQGGYVLASVNLGTEDTATDVWTYPAGVFFTWDTFRDAAETAGFRATIRPEYRTFLTSVRPNETHSWVVLR